MSVRSEPNRLPSAQVFECSICHESEVDSGQLISPCDCSGTIRYVHYECIAQWIAIKSTNKCSVCKTIYRNIEIEQKKRSFWEYVCSIWSYMAATAAVQFFFLYLSLISYIHSVIAANFGHPLLSDFTYFPSVIIFCITLASILVSLEVMRTDFREWQRSKIKYTVVPKKEEKEHKEEDVCAYNGYPDIDFRAIAIA